MKRENGDTIVVVRCQDDMLIAVHGHNYKGTVQLMVINAERERERERERKRDGVCGFEDERG